MKALDELELHLLAAGDSAALPLQQQADALKQQWADADALLFTQLLAEVQAGDRATLRRFYHTVAQQISQPIEDEALGYDELDLLTNGLLEIPGTPAEPAPLEADMVFYQPTPTRVILTLLDQLRPAPTDVFYDLGSGLGHVPILVNLLAGVRATGIEIEETYYRYALERLNKLALPEVNFINADARAMDYSAGTIFYLYTPFKGEILKQVLGKLEAEAMRRSFRVCTYGPATLTVARQPWLQSLYQAGPPEGRLGIFASAV
jgi:SAM-dependent methyltransferase